MAWGTEWKETMKDYYPLSKEVSDNIEKEYKEWTKNNREIVSEHHYITDKPPLPITGVKLNVPAPDTDHLIFECKDCNAVFDPRTSSFAKLVDMALSAGWRMKWFDEGYETICKECGK